MKVTYRFRRPCRQFCISWTQFCIWTFFFIPSRARDSLLLWNFSLFSLFYVFDQWINFNSQPFLKGGGNDLYRLYHCTGCLRCSGSSTQKKVLVLSPSEITLCLGTRTDYKSNTAKIHRPQLENTVLGCSCKWWPKEEIRGGKGEE